MQDRLCNIRLARAQELRSSATSAEKKLWRALKRLPLPNTHFRRQVPIGSFVVDFACYGSRLIVEVDGPSHSYEAQEKRDAKRTHFLEAQGFRVLRFWNDAVYNDLESVIDTILAALSTHPPLDGEGRRAKRGGVTLRFRIGIG